MSCAIDPQQKGLLTIYGITAAGGCYKNELMKVSKL
jgi:hypothetical protein